MNFKNWLINEEYESMAAEIPMPDEVHLLTDLFHKFGAKLYAVGGSIRDYLYHLFHQKDVPYNPKDIDLATDQPPEQVERILSTPEAINYGIKVFAKGSSFGVISAVINGKEFEIATFRKEYYDALVGDGRRPNEVTYSNAKEDARRRDLSVNALFYDLKNKEIKDYNIDSEGKGQGFIDIKNKKVRVVGDPFDRFREDKLRVLRLVRFFSRFNNDVITKHLDPRTMSAIDNFKDLKGISKERISAEFLSGLKTCLNTENYILSFKSLGLLNTIFPGLKVRVDDNVNKTRNVMAIIAYILRENDYKDLKQKLHQLKYSNEVCDTVFFIQAVFYDLNNKNIIKLLRMKENFSKERRISFLEYGKIIGKVNRAWKFLDYEIQTKSQDYAHLNGPEISKKMNQDEFEIYNSKRDFN
jgi:tRNA nucleotidyltransferase/poly(A) polymerase